MKSRRHRRETRIFFPQNRERQGTVDIVWLHQEVAEHPTYFCQQHELMFMLDAY